MNEAHHALLYAWGDHIRDALARDPALGCEAWTENPVETVLGIGAVGPRLEPALMVAGRQDVEVAKRWAARQVDERVRVCVTGRFETGPPNLEAHWGEVTATPGHIVGSKSFLRRDGTETAGGTLTIVAQDRRGRPAILGCLHCFAPSSGAGFREADRHLLEAGSQRPFARVTGWKQLTTNHHRWANTFDGGIARPSDAWLNRCHIGVVPGFGRVTSTCQPIPGEVVAKNGATTGLTRGHVTHSMVTSRVVFGGANEPREIVMSECTAVANRDIATGRPFGQRGDSGSPLVQEGRAGPRIAGIHFAGSPVRTLFCSIEPVLEAFSLSLPP